MTPQELGRALAEEMRKHAIIDRGIAKGHAHNAVDYQQQADNSRRLAHHFEAMAEGWELTADKLASGAIDLNDARILADLRGGLADAQEAIDPRTPFAQQREQLAAMNTPSRVFNPGDEVNVSDRDHRLWGRYGTVTEVSGIGLAVVVRFDGNLTEALGTSQLMHHDAFVAQTADNIPFVEQVNSVWSDPAVRAAVRETIAATPAPAGAWDDPADAYSVEQINGTACITCGVGFADDGSRAAGPGPDGLLFVHSDVALCVEYGHDGGAA